MKAFFFNDILSTIKNEIFIIEGRDMILLELIKTLWKTWSGGIPPRRGAATLVNGTDNVGLGILWIPEGIY